MSAYLSQEERDELNSLKQDLLGPVKSFAAEVGKDTVGDAKRFYADKARKAQQSAALAKEKAKRQAETLRQEQARARQRRRGMVRRTLIVLALIALFGAALIWAAFAAHAEDYLALGESCLTKSPPDAENAAIYFKRAGINGNAEGYYRLAQLYEDELLSIGNPCTDDIAAMSAKKAAEYYALAAQGGYAPAREKRTDAWTHITGEEAARVMAEETDYLLLDVRRQDEYDAGHIPGALCIPVESITEPPEELSDFEQTLLVYCRSGRRSKQAASKLAALGYTDVREFGGILDWTGEVVTVKDEIASKR